MIQPMPPFLDANATHGKGDDHVSLFDEGIVEVAAVHAWGGDEVGRGGEVGFGGRGGGGLGGGVVVIFCFRSFCGLG